MSYLDHKPTMSRFYTPREEGDREIRVPSDVLGKELLEEREKSASRGYKLRMKYLPELPGYKPDKLVNQYQLERYLDQVVEMRLDAQLVTHKAPEAVLSAIVGSFTKGVEDSNAFFAFGKGLFRAPRRAMDAIAQTEEARYAMIQEVNRRSVEYLDLQMQVMEAERRDWRNWRETEARKAFLEPGRIDWFTFGAALTSIDQDVSYHVDEMERQVRGWFSRVEGSSTRRMIDIAVPFTNALTGKIGNGLGSFQERN